MGCDFQWEGTATDEQQRLCGWFLESLFDANEKGISRRFPETVKCETYYGEYFGNFYELKHPKDNGLFPAKFKLVGATIHTGYREDREPGYRLWATDQLSFVFIKTGEDLGDLVTVERISDLSQPRCQWIREKVEDVETNSDLPFYVFQRRSQVRLLSNEYWLGSLLYAIKKQFMPMLHVSDDYLYFAGVSEADRLAEEFNCSILKPELASKWGFDFYSIAPTLANIAAIFEKDRIVNLNLSDEAHTTLTRAEVISISDLTYMGRDLFLRMNKPTPLVLAEIEDAMRRSGYAFEAETPFLIADEDSLDKFEEFDDIALTDEELKFAFDENSFPEDDKF